MLQNSFKGVSGVDFFSLISKNILTTTTTRVPQD